MTRGEIGVLLRVIGEALVVDKSYFSPPNHWLAPPKSGRTDKKSHLSPNTLEAQIGPSSAVGYLGSPTAPPARPHAKQVPKRTGVCLAADFPIGSFGRSGR